MAKLDDARSILLSLEMPVAQRSDICCYALLVMAGIAKIAVGQTPQTSG